MGGCRSSGPGGKRVERPAPFVQEVPGSTVTFVMRPVTVYDNGPPRVLWFAETETTWDAYDVFYLWLDEAPDGTAMGREGPDAVTRPTPPYAPPDRGWGHAGYPAIGVTFHAARKYCEWLTQKTGRRYRLPTTREWWDAAREPAAAPGNSPPAGRYWFAEHAGETTHPAVSLTPNKSNGLYNLIGNAAEWCVADDGRPVVCGGSFADRFEDFVNDLSALHGRSQSREWNVTDPSFPKSKWWLRDAPFVGFRVVCEEGVPGCAPSRRTPYSSAPSAS